MRDGIVNLLIVLLPVWCAFQLWRAATRQRIAFIRSDLSRAERPVTFWISVAFHIGIGLASVSVSIRTAAKMAGLISN